MLPLCENDIKSRIMHAALAMFAALAAVAMFAALAALATLAVLAVRAPFVAHGYLFTQETLGVVDS